MVGRFGRTSLGVLLGCAVACGSQQSSGDGRGGSSAGTTAGAGAGDAGRGAGGATTGGRAGSSGAMPSGGVAGSDASDAGAGSPSSSGNGGTGEAEPGGGEAGTNGATGGASFTGLDLSGLDPAVLAYPAPPGVDEARVRASDIVAALSSAEKASLLAGTYGVYVGNVPAVGSLPALGLNDGPGGVSWLTGVTAFPAPIAFAASWDPTLVHAWGSAMGAEERGKGAIIQLGPMMNFSRTPAGGRNFEGFGEDPFLSAELAAEDVQGIQENKIVATAKHFVGNEQETNRMSVNSLIDDRTLHEIYYLPFEASVSAGVGAVMCSYNLVNGVYACENPNTLGELKGTLGFSGWVMSDWTATHSSAIAANAGLDMEMPTADYFTESGLASVSAARIDDMATRIVSSLVRVGALDDPPTGSTGVDVTSDAHTAIALQGATEAITLLKNAASALPFDASVRSLAVLGSPGGNAPYSSGGGSAHVTGEYVTSPFDAITALAPAGTSVTYAAGDQGDTTDAVEAATNADAAVVFIAVDSTEGADRSLELSDEQNALVSDVAAVNPRTVVVLNVPGAVMLPWLDQVSGLVVAWYPGQENGSAIASMLFGDTNPSGKLPVTFPATEDALPLAVDGTTVSYAEGLAVGYRSLDALGVDPLFEFGFGLSYTTFAYSNLELAPGTDAGSLSASFDLENTGGVGGTEVSELYLTFPASAGEPPRVLRGFERVTLDPGERQRVTLELPVRAFTCWNPTAHARFAPSGDYELWIGSSSRTLPLHTTFTVTGLGPEE
jgi:beta-glucosidase